MEPEQYVPDTFPESETLYARTRNVVFFRDVWQLEFSFLPLRQLRVEAASGNGEPVGRNIWYLVYRVRNTGVSASHDQVQDPRFGHVDHVINTAPEQVDPITLPGRFFGVFTLTGWVQDVQTGMYSAVEYQESILPDVHAIIAREEDPDQEYLDTVQIAQQILEKFPPDSDQGGKWGIAIWYNVDPRINFISVKVNGLTNAFRLERNPDDSLTVRNKVLQLNFWRPGDSIDEDLDDIRYGIPLMDAPQDQIEVARRYRLPGPIIRGESVNLDNLRTTIVFETDAELDPVSFDSAVAAQLDTGQIPEAVVEGFRSAGITLGGDAALTTDVPGSRWTVTDTWENEKRSFVIRLHPEFWEKTINGGIRFIKRLDNLWVYE
jgi:hypothetical protein